MEKEDLAKTISQIIENLAGKEADLELSFRDLTLDMAGVKLTLNGSVVLDIKYIKEKD